MSGLSFLDGGGGVSFEGSLMGELSPKVGLIFFLPLIQWLVGSLSPFLHPQLRMCLSILERGEPREGERQKQQSFASRLCPSGGLNLQARHVP